MKKSLLMLCALAASVMLKAQSPYPIIPIDSVQYADPAKLPDDQPDYISPTFKNPTYRDTVRFEGIVVTNPKLYGLSASRKAAYIQKEGGGPWSGVLVMCEPSGSGLTLQQLNQQTAFYDNFQVGYKVLVTGIFKAFDNETQMNLIKNSNPNWSNAVEQTSLTPVTPVVTVITVDSVTQGNPATGITQRKDIGEKWEGVYVELRNVNVYARVQGINNNTKRWAWTVIDDNGNSIEIRDMSGHFRNDGLEDLQTPHTFQPPSIGTRLSYLRGIITEYKVGGANRYGITPIMPEDVGPCTVCPPSINNITRTPIPATASDVVTVSAKVTGQAPIDSVNLYYAVGITNNKFTSIPMVMGANDIWSGSIPAQAVDSIVKYYIRAIDNRGIKLTLPDTLATGSQYLVVPTGGITQISLLQKSIVSNLTSIWSGDSLTGMDVRGIVTSIKMSGYATVQQGTGPNSAIFVAQTAGDATSGWKIGDSVQIVAGIVRENFNVTTLYNITSNTISSGNQLPPFELNLPMDSFIQNKIAYARPYEGVLMRWDNKEVIAPNADSASSAGASNFGEWTFGDAGAPLNKALRADDMAPALLNINRTFVVGTHFDYIQGPMYFSFSNFKLMPRGLFDLGMCDIDSFAPVIVLNGENPDTVSIGSGAYTDPGVTSAFDNRDGDMKNYVIVSGSVNTNALGSYTLTYKVSDLCGKMDSVTRTVVVKDTTGTVGLRNNELASADIKVYPSPASDNITISINDVKSMPVYVSIIDVLGREVANRTYKQNNVSDNINVSSFNSGVYFCVISNETGTRTIRFMVSGK